MPQANWAYIRIRMLFKRIIRAITKHLRRCFQLRVYFETYGWNVFHMFCACPVRGKASNGVKISSPMVGLYALAPAAPFIKTDSTPLEVNLKMRSRKNLAPHPDRLIPLTESNIYIKEGFRSNQRRRRNTLKHLLSRTVLDGK